MKIRKCTDDDTPLIYEIINESAKAYKPVLPQHVYHEPQMSMKELLSEMKRIKFYAAVENDDIVGVMGYEFIKDVALIRHSYIKPNFQRKGFGSRLLEHLEALIQKADPSKIIAGTYENAFWAIAFYQKHGYNLVEDHDAVLRKYYNIPAVQRENSVALEKKI
jgi:ribosomal protein S18 acetylase RimI-like enzyme